MTVQVSSFSTGGFVVHGLDGNFSGKLSAWFDRAGTLLAAEQITERGIIRSVREGGPLWQWAERQAVVYRPNH